MRTLLALLFLTAISFAATWIVDHDGVIMMRWLGHQIETTVTFLVFTLLLSSLFIAFAFYLVIWTFSVPGNYRKALLERRREKGLVALTEGFAAVAAGDAKQARTLTKKAQNTLGAIGLTRLLSAQAAHLEGNKQLEREQYGAMLEDKNTEMIAVKGLLLAAKEDGDLSRAISLAEKAITLQDNAAWAFSILFDLYKRTQKWQKALEVLEQLQRHKMLDKAQYKQTKATLSLAIGHTLLDQGFGREAMSHFAFAQKELPGFSPAIVAYATALMADKQKRKALKVLESGWKHTPHVAIASYYMSLYDHETATKKLKQADKLYHMHPNHPDGHIIVARTAMRCGELNKARSHLKLALAEEETKTICELMVELETIENASQDIIQKWQARIEQAPHDENWVCQSCSHISHSWHPNCTNCDAFDSYEWQMPGKQVNVTPAFTTE